MRIDVFTIFPEYLAGPLGLSLIGRARERGLVDLRLHDPRDHTDDRHRTVDDAPFGGGPGMVMRPEPLFDAVEAAQPPRPLLLLSASGRRFDQAMARELAAGDGFSLLCGRYEGVDQRVADHLCDGEVSVGDVVLAGGEAGALVIIEAVTRLRARGHGQRRVGGGGVVRRRAARVPAVHPARPSTGAGPCPRCCARATTPGSPAWRRTAAPPAHRRAPSGPAAPTDPAADPAGRPAPTGSDGPRPVGLASQPAPTALPKDLYAP